MKIRHPAGGMSGLHNGNGNGAGNGTTTFVQQLASKAAAKPPVVPTPQIKESGVTFHSAESGALRGSLRRMTRHAAFFELYNPDFLPRYSEALDKFKITVRDEIVYTGRAVVGGLMNTGTTIICEVSLDEAGWTPLNLAESLRLDGQVAKEFKTFLQDWQKLYKVSSEFKVVVADMQTILHDLRIWLDQVESGMQTLPPVEREKAERQLLAEVGKLFVPAFDALHEKLEAISGKLDQDLRPAHRAFAQRQLHALMLCSPFGHRAYTKPLGYAGDYEMVNMIALDPYQGASLYAKTVNLWFLSQWPSAAHRNRLTYLKNFLEQETVRVSATGRKMRVFNFACGPALEIQRFIADFPFSDQVEFTLADFNQETLDQLAEKIRRIKQQSGRRTSVQFRRRNIVQVLKESLKKSEHKPEYDVVYCAGLFDYLPDSTCSQLMEVFYDWLAPGGLLAVTNVVDDKPFRHMLEFILDWNLIYRDTREGMAIFPASIPSDVRSIKKDPTGVNIFIEARKPSE